MNPWRTGLFLLGVCFGLGLLQGACGEPPSGKKPGQEVAVENSALERPRGEQATIVEKSIGQEQTLQDGSGEFASESKTEPLEEIKEKPEPVREAAVENSTPETTAEAMSDAAPDSLPDNTSRTCKDVQKDYSGLVAKNIACLESADCHVVLGYCGVGLGGCWHVVSKKLTQSSLMALRDQWTRLSCRGPVCSCTPPPKAVSCVAGTCKAGAANACDSIRSSYTALVKSNVQCKQDSDCHVLNGHCGVGLGGCYYAVNKSLNQAKLDQLAKQFRAQKCTGPVCRCPRPPSGASCDNNVCKTK